MIGKLAHYIRRKVVNFYYDFKTLIKSMGINLKENLIICKN
jgi:hypothetical protein